MISVKIIGCEKQNILKFKNEYAILLKQGKYWSKWEDRCSSFVLEEISWRNGYIKEDLTGLRQCF